MQTKVVSLADELHVVLPDEIISALQLQEGDDLAIRMVGAVRSKSQRALEA